jgi:MauM/NapG family ferredoxin protein
VQLKPGDRRDFLRQSIGKWGEKLLEQAEERMVHQKYFRPPGALPEVAFLTACTRCGACAPVCPADAIVMLPPRAGLAAGTPHLEPTLQPCTVCPDMPCAAACPTGALTLPEGGWDGYRIGALEFVPERCVTYQGTACRVCADACPVGEAALTIDEAGHPVLKQEGCVGCGVCVRACITSPSSFNIQAVEQR